MTPTTNAGRALLSGEMTDRFLIAIGDRPSTEDELAADICAVEAGTAAERARIRAAVEGLLDPDTGKSWNHALNTVLRIIDGGEG